jgi:hypothetical protein
MPMPALCQRDCLDQREELGDVAAGQFERRRDTAALDDHVVLEPGLARLTGLQCFGHVMPPARASCRSPSATSPACPRVQLGHQCLVQPLPRPASFHPARRRQQVTLGPNPSSWGQEPSLGPGVQHDQDASQEPVRDALAVQPVQHVLLPRQQRLDSFPQLAGHDL